MRCLACVVALVWAFAACSGTSEDGLDLSSDLSADSQADVATDLATDLPTDLPHQDTLVDLADEIADLSGEDLAVDSSDIDAVDWVEEVADKPLPEERVEEAGTGCDGCLVIQDEEWNGADDLSFPSVGEYDQEIEGLMVHFRPWIRFRLPHPGVVERIYLYTAGAGELEVGLSTGFPGGHHPCLDENTGDDLYPVAPSVRMSVSEEPGWRVIDVSELGFAVGGYDEFFVIFSQIGDARVGLAPPREFDPSDFDTQGGLVADPPGDGLTCFPSMSTFTEALGNPLIWVVRAEIGTTQQPQERVFLDHGDDGPNVGGHVSFGDFDNDMDEDFLSNGHLWENDGVGGFTDITVEAGLEGVGGETVWGDYDNDGWRDIVSISGQTRLFHNLGDGSFEEVTETAGLDTLANNQGVAWVDFDGDAFLDLYIASYGTAEDSEVPERDYLFHSNGDGTFTDVTEAMGIPLDKKHYHGRGVCVADYDEDGDPDIYVANYRLDPNFLWQNQGGMAGFLERAYASGVQGYYSLGSYGHGIGPAFGDLDGDGLFDLLVPNLAHPRFFDFSDPTTVYINQGDGTFEGFLPPTRGIIYDETHSGATLFDFDGDGDLDAFLTSIYVGRRSQLYENDGTAQFTDVTYEAGIEHFNGWGSAAGDIDGDGDLDLVAHRLFENQSPAGKVLQVKLYGGATPEQFAGLSNRDAIGAVARVTFDGKTLVRQVEGGKGVGCQNSSVLHFGVGNFDGTVTLDVTWPSGKTTHVEQVETGQLLELAEPLESEL